MLNDDDTMEICNPRQLHFATERPGSQKVAITCSRSNRSSLESRHPRSSPPLPFTPGELLIYSMVSTVSIEFTHGCGITQSHLHVNHKNADLIHQFLPCVPPIPCALTLHLFYQQLQRLLSSPFLAIAVLAHPCRVGQGDEQAWGRKVDSSQGRICNWEAFGWHTHVKRPRKNGFFKQHK